MDFPEKADVYEHLLRQEVFPGIVRKGVPGYRGIQLFRRVLPSGEVEFLTFMTFDSMDAVRGFAGEDYERAYVPHQARALLSRFEERSQHFELREELRH